MSWADGASEAVGGQWVMWWTEFWTSWGTRGDRVTIVDIRERVQSWVLLKVSLRMTDWNWKDLPSDLGWSGSVATTFTIVTRQPECVLAQQDLLCTPDGKSTPIRDHLSVIVLLKSWRMFDWSLSKRNRTHFRTLHSYMFFPCTLMAWQQGVFTDHHIQITLLYLTPSGVCHSIVEGVSKLSCSKFLYVDFFTHFPYITDEPSSTPPLFMTISVLDF